MKSILLPIMLATVLGACASLQPTRTEILNTGRCRLWRVEDNWQTLYVNECQTDQLTAALPPAIEAPKLVPPPQIPTVTINVHRETVVDSAKKENVIIGTTNAGDGV